MPSGGGAFRETQDRVLDSAPQALTSCPRKGKAVTASLADIGTVPPPHTHPDEDTKLESWGRAVASQVLLPGEPGQSGDPDHGKNDLPGPSGREALVPGSPPSNPRASNR